MSLERQKVKDVIHALYKSAGIHKKFTGDVNERLAEVLGNMIVETGGRSEALAWVPRPPGGKASITWTARHIARSIIDSLGDRESLTCARAVIYKWDRALQMAARGLSCAPF